MYRPNAVKATRGSPRKAAGGSNVAAFPSGFITLCSSCKRTRSVTLTHQCPDCPSAGALQPSCHCETPRACFWPQVYHPHGKASRLEDNNQSRRQPHLPLRDAGGADLLQDLLELGIAHLCQKLPLWQHHIPAVILYEVKRLVYGLQHMGDRIGTPSPACQLLVMPNTCRGFRHAGI